MRKRKVRRFPRYLFSSRDKLAERIIWTTYNNMARARNMDKRVYQLDVYKTRAGKDAKLKFLLLGQRLVKAGIDPALFIKVLCSYGKFKDARYMPLPGFFAGEKAWEIFQWKLGNQMRKYGKDLKQNLGAESDEQVLQEIRNGADSFNLCADRWENIPHPNVIMADVKPEVSPWFIAAYIKHRKGWAAVRECLEFFKRHRHISKEAREILKQGEIIS